MLTIFMKILFLTIWELYFGIVCSLSNETLTVKNAEG